KTSLQEVPSSVRVPPEAYETASRTAARGITVNPRSRKRGLQPQIRYAPTTSQTKRFREPAHVPHGKPSAREAWTTRSAVWASHPILTPHVARRPSLPGFRTFPAWAPAAAP